MELLYRMTNSNNVKVVVNQLITFLNRSSDYNFRKDLVMKIISLADKYSPSYEWYVSVMNVVFEKGSKFVDDYILNTFLRSLTEKYEELGSSFGEYLIDTYLQIIKNNSISDITYKLTAWVFGEIGSATCNKLCHGF